MSHIPSFIRVLALAFLCSILVCSPVFGQPLRFSSKPLKSNSQVIFAPAHRPKSKPVVARYVAIPKEYRPWWGLLSVAMIDAQDNGESPAVAFALQNHPNCQTNMIAQSVLQRHGQAVLDSTGSVLKLASYHASLTHQATKNMGVFVEHLQCLDRSGVRYWDQVLSSFLTDVAINNPPEISLCEAFWSTWSPALNVIDLLQSTGKSKLINFYKQHKYKIENCAKNHADPSGSVAMLTPFSGDKLVLLAGVDELENLIQVVTEPIHLGAGLCPLLDHAHGLVGGSLCTNGFSKNSACSLEALNDSLMGAGISEVNTSSHQFSDGSGFSLMMDISPPTHFFGIKTEQLPQKLGISPQNCNEESRSEGSDGDHNLGVSFAAPTGFHNSCLLSHAHERKTSSHGHKMATCAKKYAPPGANLNTQGETITMAESECGLVQGSDKDKKSPEKDKDKAGKENSDPKEKDPSKKDSNKDKSDKEKNDPKSKENDNKPWQQKAIKDQKDPLSQTDKDILFKIMNDLLKSLGRKPISKKIFNNGYKDMMKNYYILNSEAVKGVDEKDQSKEVQLWDPDDAKTVGYVSDDDHVIAVSPYMDVPILRKGILVHEIGHVFADKLGISEKDYHDFVGPAVNRKFYDKYFHMYKKHKAPNNSGSQMQIDLDGSGDTESCHETEAQRRVRLLGNCMFGDDGENGELPDAPIDALSYPDPLKEDPICSEYNGSELRENSGTVVDPSPMEDFQQQPEPQPNTSNQFIDPPKPEPGS